MKTLEDEGTARSTRRNYQIYFNGHVRPYLAARLLPKLHRPTLANGSIS